MRRVICSFAWISFWTMRPQCILTNYSVYCMSVFHSTFWFFSTSAMKMRERMWAWFVCLFVPQPGLWIHRIATWLRNQKKNNISLTFCSCPACFMNCLRHKIIFFYVSMYIPAHIGQRIHLTVTQTQRICVRATHESFSCIHCMCSSSWMAMRTKSTGITRNNAHTATHARTRVNNIGIHLFYTWEYNSSTCLIYVRSLHAYRYTYGILNILFGSIYIWNSGIWFRSFSYVFSVVATSVHSLNVSVTFQTKNNNNKWQMHHRIWCLLRRTTKPVFESNKFLFSSIRAAFDHQHCWLTHFLPHWLTPSFFAVSRIQRSHFSSRFLFNRCC